jgi:hypothetical protein
MRSWIVVWILLIVFSSQASTSSSGVEEALLHLVEVNTRHPVYRDSAWRANLAHYIVEAAEAYELDPFFLTTMVFYESAFRPSARGDLGEVGLGQLHGVAKKGCDLSTPEGQLRCTARWLAYSRQLCDGSLEQTIARYATGDICTPEKGSRLQYVVGIRMRMYTRLKKNYDD